MNSLHHFISSNERLFIPSDFYIGKFTISQHFFAALFYDLGGILSQIKGKQVIRLFTSFILKTSAIFIYPIRAKIDKRSCAKAFKDPFWKCLHSNQKFHPFHFSISHFRCFSVPTNWSVDVDNKWYTISFYVSAHQSSKISPKCSKILRLELELSESRHQL